MKQGQSSKRADDSSGDLDHTVDHRRAEPVEPTAQALDPLRKWTCSQVGTAGNHHTGRLAARVGIDHLDALEIGHGPDI